MSYIVVHSPRMAGEKDDRLELRVPSRLKKALEVLAERDRRKISDYVRVALEDHVKARMGGTRGNS
jgi:predicted DNA-binding protein